MAHNTKCWYVLILWVGSMTYSTESRVLYRDGDKFYYNQNGMKVEVNVKVKPDPETLHQKILFPGDQKSIFPSFNELIKIRAPEEIRNSQVADYERHYLEDYAQYIENFRITQRNKNQLFKPQSKSSIEPVLFLTGLDYDRIKDNDGTVQATTGKLAKFHIAKR